MFNLIAWALLITTPMLNMPSNTLTLYAGDIPANTTAVVRLQANTPINSAEASWNADAQCSIDWQSAVCQITTTWTATWPLLTFNYTPKTDATGNVDVRFDFSNSDEVVRPNPAIVVPDNNGVVTVSNADVVAVTTNTWNVNNARTWINLYLVWAVVMMLMILWYGYLHITNKKE